MKTLSTNDEHFKFHGARSFEILIADWSIVRDVTVFDQSAIRLTFQHGGRVLTKTNTETIKIYLNDTHFYINS